MEGGKSMSAGERSFTIEGSGTGFNGGRYKTKTSPLSAAKKAGARLYRELTESQIKSRESKGKKDIKFILKETTRGSKKETLFFRVKRVTLSKPVVRTIAGKTIQSKYVYEIERCGSNVKLE
jgi:hypothetical protein